MQVNTPPRRRTLLVIMDGFGLNPSKINNGIAAAKTPRLDEYFELYSLTELQASGAAVGLPEGQMGNSEVGHLTLGTGAIQRQDLVKINDSIIDNSFYENPVLIAAITKAKQQNKPLHLMGLVSNGGVHSHVDHLFALIELCKHRQVTPLLHIITDGRDTAPQSAIDHIDQIDTELAKANGSIATVCGRYFMMDRDKRWDRTELAWQALVNNVGRKASSYRDAICSAYERGETDEFIRPIILPNAQPITAEDAVIFFNFPS